MKKEEFMQQIEGCRLPEIFDQYLLDSAAEMFSRWGMTTHMDEKEHFFERSGPAPKPGDSDALNRKDAGDIIKNFNKIKDPGFEWVEG